MKFRLLRGLLAAVAVLGFFASALSAQENPSKASPGITATPAPLSSGYGGGGMIQVIGLLFLLMVLFAGGMYFLKHGAVFLQSKNKGVRKLLINETRMLGGRQFLVVAEYEDKKMLIGVCPGRIDYLCQLGGRDETFSSVLPEKPE